jgi:hypothetical protein
MAAVTKAYPLDARPRRCNIVRREAVQAPLRARSQGRGVPPCVSACPLTRDHDD